MADSATIDGREQRKKGILAILCCHAIFFGTNPLDESHWALAPFQKSLGPEKPGEHHTFISHMEHALNFAKSRTDVAVVFSGGRTKPEYPDISEAQSYLDASKKLSVYPSALLDHVILEENATDLFQNVLFSLLRYYAIMRTYPEEIIVVSHRFKEPRLELHRRAIRWIRPFSVLGVDPPFSDNEREQVEALEHRNAYLPFMQDPYGVRNPLYAKKLSRRWDDSRLDEVAESQPVTVKNLVRWVGGEDGDEIFPHELPWENQLES